MVTASFEPAVDLPLIVVILGLFVGAAGLGLAEVSLLRVPRFRVAVEADAGRRRAVRLLRLLDDLPRVLNVVLLTVLLFQVATATIAGVLAERWFGNLGVTVASIVVTALLFVYAEAIPKTIAVRSPLRSALRVTPAITVLARLLRPVVHVLVWFADLQAPGEGVTLRATVTEEELRLLARESARAGEIEPSDARLVEQSFHFGDIRAGEVMVPRHDVVAVAADTPAEDALGRAVRHGHRRLPVHRGSLDEIVGVVRSLDLAAAVRDDLEVTAGELVDAVLRVGQETLIAEVLTSMQDSGLRFAVVHDGAGATLGIVTVEDLVAELVGEIEEEED